MMALMLAVVMMMAMGLTAMAADIEVQNADKDQIYKAYMILKYAYNEDADSFTYYIDDETKFTAINALDLGFEFADDTTYGHVLTNAKDIDAATLTTALKANLTALETAAIEKSSVTASGDPATATFEGLNAGYWFITSTTGTLVSLESFDAKEIVFDKNQIPDVDKVITDADTGTVEDEGKTADANIGDVITYNATVTAHKGSINLVFHDKMDEGLTFLPDEGITVTGGNITEDDYEIVYSNANAATAADGDVKVGDNITIRFHNSYLKGLTDDATLTIEYKAQINEDAVIGQTGNKNTVELDYGHTPGSEDDENSDGEPSKTTEEKSTTVYTWALALKKVNDKGADLAEAIFSLPFYVTADDESGNYTYAGTSKTDGAVNSITTTDNGTITIKGVASGSYNFTETAAPAGYNKISGNITVEAVKTSESTTTTSITKYLDKDGNVVATEQQDGSTVTYTNSDIPVGALSVVVNKAGAELPSTGGIGTTIFYVVGALLVIGAGVLLVTRRRMRAE